MPRTCTDATKRQIAALDVFPSTWGTWLQGALSDCYHGKPMSLERERRMCVALGIDAPPPECSVPACPDCGSVHHARCNGNDGAVVVLAPGETVRRPRGPWQSKAKPEVAAMVRGLQLCLERKQAQLVGPVPGLEVTP